MKVVIDTNVLVSALWKQRSNAGFLMFNVVMGLIRPCYDSRIMEEYIEVLGRKKFGFHAVDVQKLLKAFSVNGIFITPKPLLDIEFIDEDDRAFYEVAKYCKAPLVTGNTKHYPDDPIVVTLTDFCTQYLREDLL